MNLTTMKWWFTAPPGGFKAGGTYAGVAYSAHCWGKTVPTLQITAISLAPAKQTLTMEGKLTAKLTWSMYQSCNADVPNTAAAPMKEAVITDAELVATKDVPAR